MMLLIAALLICSTPSQAMVKIQQSQVACAFDIDFLHNDFWKTIESRDINEVENIFSSKEIFDINNKRDGKTALIYAAGNGLTKLACKLIEERARIEETDKEGWTALMLAIWMGNFDVAYFLKLHGADINHQDKYGKSILMWVAQRGDAETVRTVVAAWADPALCNDKNDHKIALDYAPAHMQKEIDLALHAGLHDRQTYEKLAILQQEEPEEFKHLIVKVRARAPHEAVLIEERAE